MIDTQTVDPLALPYVLLDDRRRLPSDSGVYFAIDQQNVVQYIGRSKNIRKRWRMHHRLEDLKNLDGVKLAYICCDSSLLLEIENALIARFLPRLSPSYWDLSKWGTEAVKRFDNPSMKVTLKLRDEHIPVDHKTGKLFTDTQIADEIRVNEYTVMNLRRGTEKGAWLTVVKLSRWLSEKFDRKVTIEEILDIEE